ncbi:hypothetical protein DDB_G0280657 [Dictyostelium discoideum AX4]|uniref:hypothetical protein n=1 Tax=Dictyostelium discoideum AX4 TaxID=352472 RepID=UPI00004E372C|nr:hypothetical protein DDB_G0280657 [Dictyostelium discoideum AX4]EAL67130.1 hypothetical protein DDB_G0280657 [Dictyostelium discoideum AX4]|eukprot:XP_641107.1 hypothetical protein DDB_G0280657 [Dictyostelium discoideum AX4]
MDTHNQIKSALQTQMILAQMLKTNEVKTYKEYSILKQYYNIITEPEMRPMPTREEIFSHGPINPMFFNHKHHNIRDVYNTIIGF